MNKKTGKIILFLGIFLVFFLKAGFACLPVGKVFALEVPLPGLDVSGPNALGKYVCYLIGLLTTAAISIAVIVIAFGGIYYLISYGRGKFTSEAKEWVKAGILGLLIIVCASSILYTINPNLTSCQVGVLSKINININGAPSTLPPGVTVTAYKEIPIGTLTETLLTRTMDCYGFDQDGNPVDGAEITSGTAGPTYLNHDRADCLLQLADGAQKKGQVIATLSDKITNLMNQCVCDQSTCSPDCDPTNGCQVQGCPGGSCVGACANGTCKQFPGTPAMPARPDCCPTDSGVKDPNNAGKNLSVKDLIEHGPIAVDVSAVGSDGISCTEGAACNPDLSCPNGLECDSNTNTCGIGYWGLDEFRCPNPQNSSVPCSDIAGFVEEQVRANGKAIIVINQDNWAKLNLVQQSTYFKEKIDEIKQKIQDDEDVLDQARSQLSSCYLAVPYVDLLKTYESTNQQNHIILTEKIFSDPETGETINASKYCQGFNYANSSCLKKCNDLCPDASGTAMSCYAGCTGSGKSQEKCIENCYNSRPCTNGTTSYSSFNKTNDDNSCISSCQDDCLNICDEKYLSCSDEYDFCQSQCENNGQCVLDNAGDCLFGAGAFQYCASHATPEDPGNTNFCINNAYLCKNGSNEYAGYSDCVDSTISGCSADEYSSSFLYDSFINDNPGCEKCPYPYKSPDKYSVCYSKTNTTASCLDMCPETAKCPASSNCPDCPCDQIENQTINFSVPNTSNTNNAGNEGYYTSGITFSAYQMVGPQCNGYFYNDDPLTFYCENNWWENPNREGLSPTPLGENLRCSKQGEIPVGRTVDDAKNWADTLINNADSINNDDIQPMLDQMKKIGDAKDTSPIQDYCKCNARLETNEPICKTGCQYSQFYVPPTKKTAGFWVCNCAFMPCDGNPCQQITDYLSELWNDYGQFKLDFIDFYTYMIKEPRSDIMKELTYSRQTTDNCSSVNKSSEAGGKLLDCTRAEQEITSPVRTSSIKINNQSIYGYCYGTELGKIFNPSSRLNRQLVLL